jgi:chromosome partitioning protein
MHAEPAIDPRTRCLVIANEKGGVGKTTTAYHAAHKLAEKRRVLVIDLDQQASALTEPLRAFASSVSAIDLFAEPTLVPPVGPLTLAPRTRQLEVLERENLAELGETFRASLRLNAEHYDAIVIDTPPAFGVRTNAALLVADLVVAPIELNEASLEAVQSVVDCIAAVCRAFGKPMPDLTRRRPLLVSRYSRHSPRQRALFEDLSSRVGKIVIDGAVVSRDAYARYRAEERPVWDMRDARGHLSTSLREASDEMRGVLDEVERMMEFAPRAAAVAS